MTWTQAPIFRYYAYDTNGAVSTTPLAAPLSAEDAARVVQVSVSFEIPARSGEADDSAVFGDTALLRFTPPAADPSTENLPCA